MQGRPLPTDGRCRPGALVHTSTRTATARSWRGRADVAASSRRPAQEASRPSASHAGVQTIGSPPCMLHKTPIAIIRHTAGALKARPCARPIKNALRSPPSGASSNRYYSTHRRPRIVEARPLVGEVRRVAEARDHRRREPRRLVRLGVDHLVVVAPVRTVNAANVASVFCRLPRAPARAARTAPARRRRAPRASRS